MTIYLIIGISALLSFAVGLVLGAAIGGGGRADQDFQEYVQKQDSEI